MVVVGPSGCGKSTLLCLISGLDEPSEGKILINNQCVNEVPAAKRDMAMVFQNYALYPHMTVFDNMAYALKMRRFSTTDIKKRVTDVAKLLQLTDYLERKPHALYGGQKQRVAMGRAIVRSPAPEWLELVEDNVDLVLAIRPEHVQLCSEENQQGIELNIEFVDDMGADKLIQARCTKNDERLSLRVLADQPYSNGTIHVELPKLKLHVFYQKTGKRIGEWRG
jgi:ABC-type sugar transport system ATPase subunit